MAHKLDIFETLSAIDQKDYGYLSEKEPDVRKAFAPPVVLRWASAVTNGQSSELYIWLVNERANIHFWDISEHPDLQYKLMASCGLGKRHRHMWIPMAKTAKKTSVLFDFIRDMHPNINSLELDILLNKYTEEEFTDLVHLSGYPEEQMKGIKDAFRKYKK